MTKHSLFALMGRSMSQLPVTVQGLTGHVLIIAREDGSGRCFNVTLRLVGSNQAKTVFVRTID